MKKDFTFTFCAEPSNYVIGPGKIMYFLISIYIYKYIDRYIYVYTYQSWLRKPAGSWNNYMHSCLRLFLYSNLHSFTALLLSCSRNWRFTPMDMTVCITALVHLNMMRRQSLKIICIGNYFMTNIVRDKKKKFKMLQRNIIYFSQTVNINSKRTLNFYFYLLIVFYIPHRCLAVYEPIEIQWTLVLRSSPFVTSVIY